HRSRRIGDDAQRARAKRSRLAGRGLDVVDLAAVAHGHVLELPIEQLSVEGSGLRPPLIDHETLGPGTATARSGRGARNVGPTAMPSVDPSPTAPKTLPMIRWPKYSRTRIA